MGKYREITNQILELYKEGKSGTAFVNGDLGAGFKPYFREE